MPETVAPEDPSETEDPAFLERVMRYLDDALSPEGTEIFKQELAGHPRKREAFVLICISDTLSHEELPAMMAGITGEFEPQPEEEFGKLSETMILPAIGVAPNEVNSSDEADLPTPTPFQLPQKKPKPRWRQAGGWAAMLILGISLFAYFRSGKAPMVATLTAVADAQWQTQSTLAPGDNLTAGQELELKAGCASLRFSDDAQVIVEAPARLKLTSTKAIELISGKVSVKMPHGSSGFVVATPQTTVTDLGTEFGVSVDPVTLATDVHVFLGQVQVVMPAANTRPQNIAAGEMAHVAAGAVTVTPGASMPQLFVRSITDTTSALDLADLISGGDGTNHRTSGVIDPTTGVCSSSGALSPWYVLAKTAQDRPLSDGKYHPVVGLPVVSGCFVPDASGNPAQVDPLSHAFSFPVTSGVTSMRICCGGKISPAPNGDSVVSTMRGTDYSAPDHSFVLLHSNVGITLDLAEIHHLHPNTRLTGFHCELGNSDPSSTPARGKADFFVLVDGSERFSKRQFSVKDGVFSVDVALGDSDRFVTLAATDGGDTVWCDMVLLGDPAFSLVPGKK